MSNLKPVLKEARALADCLGQLEEPLVADTV